MSADRDDVEAVLGSILATEQNGLSLRRLDEEYRSIVGCQIPFRELGHVSLTAFLKSISNVVAIHRHLDGNVTVYGAHNAATAHITKMVAQQKPSKNRRPGPMRGRQSQDAQRPCHWQVHPYRKTGQQNRQNWNARGAQSTQVGANNPRAAAPRGGPMAPARVPLLELPSNSQNHSLRTNRPACKQWFQQCPGQPFATSLEQGSGGSAGFHRPEMRTWTLFLAGTGVAAHKVPAYAEVLHRHGVDPGGLWLFTAQDIRRMGIVDHHDVRLLQERAHAVRTVLGPAIAGNSLYDPSHRAANERWQHNNNFGNINHWPKHHDQRQVNRDLCVTVRSGCSRDRPVCGHNNRSDLNESQEWLEDDRLYLTPPLRRSRALRMKHGLQVTPRNLTSVVGRVSVKDRLGWRF